jgi:hypothetical protein
MGGTQGGVRDEGSRMVDSIWRRRTERAADDMEKAAQIWPEYSTAKVLFIECLLLLKQKASPPVPSHPVPSHPIPPHSGVLARACCGGSGSVAQLDAFRRFAAAWAMHANAQPCGAGY